MKIISYYIVIFSIFLFTNLTFAQWTKIEGPLFNGNGSAVLTFDSLIIAGMNGDGILVSTDNGLIWNQRNSNLQGQFVNCLGVADSTIIAGTGQGIYISSDKGKNWVVTNMTNGWINSIAFYDSVAFAGTTGGIFYSTDKGKNWMQGQNSLNNNYAADCFAFDSSLIL